MRDDFEENRIDLAHASNSRLATRSPESTTASDQPAGNQQRRIGLLDDRRPAQPGLRRQIVLLMDRSRSPAAIEMDLALARLGARVRARARSSPRRRRASPPPPAAT